VRIDLGDMASIGAREVLWRFDAVLLPPAGADSARSHCPALGVQTRAGFIPV